MSTLSTLTSAQLIKAAKLKEQIAKLEKELNALFGSSAPVKTSAKPVRKKGKMSAAGRARIVAAQKARWAKIKGTKAKPAAKTVSKPAKRKISAEGLARIKAAQKARWAKVKAAKKA